jgi:hypothetical protein
MHGGKYADLCFDERVALTKIEKVEADEEQMYMQELGLLYAKKGSSPITATMKFTIASVRIYHSLHEKPSCPAIVMKCNP